MLWVFFSCTALQGFVCFGTIDHDWRLLRLQCSRLVHVLFRPELARHSAVVSYDALSESSDLHTVHSVIEPLFVHTSRLGDQQGKAAGCTVMATFAVMCCQVRVIYQRHMGHLLVWQMIAEQACLSVGYVGLCHQLQ